MVSRCKPVVSALGLVVLLVHCPPLRADNWEATCPTTCECKYYNNKKVANCLDAGFSTIPSTLSSSIHVLDLTNNNIKALEQRAFEMVDLINLHKLTLAGNKIRDIDKTAFSSLKLLMDLDLANNQIETLHPKTFAGMEKMRYLNLDGNILSRLIAYQFPILPNLQHLSINNCRLSYINSHAFSNLHRINSVTLTGNLLKLIQPELFSGRPELKSVALGDNPWVCDCNIKKLIDWIQRKKMGETEIACASPKRMAGKEWLTLNDRELACAPEILVPQSEVSINLGGNATLACGATGDPLPKMKWILDGRLLTNLTELTIPFSEFEPNVKFMIHEDLVDGLLWTNLTVIQMGEDFMLHGYDQNSPFTCIVENPAKIVERNLTLVIGMVVESPIITGSYLDIYVLIAIIAVAVLLLVLLILICVCCFRRRRRNERPVVKANGGGGGGSGGGDKAFMERNNILIVNPVEKPPRKNELYEKLPQADIELTDLQKGGHKSFEEMNYPEERVGRVRSPLTPLEEEEFDQASQQLLNESLNTTVTVDYSLQFPDLLDNVKFPRAISPTQLSYHSLVNPLYSPNPDWRYSYVYPSEYPSRHNGTTPYQRPGYVTLPRRPRTSSVTSAPPSMSRQQLSPTLKLEPVYDTLGPRTTADGTSRTDLTRPMSRSMMDPYNPPTPLSPSTTPSLPLHYVSIPGENHCLPNLLAQSSTLPRSTPNLLEDKGLSAHYILEEQGKQRQSPHKNKLSNADNDNKNNNSPPTQRALTKPSTLKVNPSLPSPSSTTPLKIKPTLKNSNRNKSSTKSHANGHTSPLSDLLQSQGKRSLPNGFVLNTDDASSTGSAPLVTKKVPPKPPPKPSVKRLSIASTVSEGASSKLSQGGSASALNYQDEGPDGTEV